MRVLKNIAQFLIVSLLLIGGYVAYRVFLGAKIGETCSDSNSCAQLFGSQCLHDPSGTYCTRVCTSDHDCPTEWVCASAHELDTRTTTERVCSRARGSVRRAPAEEQTTPRRAR